MSVERVTIDVDGPVSVLDYGGDGPLLVAVHGLEGSAYNWSLIAPELTKTHHVVAPDLSGFGYTPPADRGSSVEANVELVAGVIKHYGDSGLVIGNSMGGLITILLAELYPDRVSGLVLIDPAAPVSTWWTVSPAAAARLSTPLIPVLGSRAIEAYRSAQTVDERVAEALEFVCADAAALHPEIWEHATEISQLRESQDWTTDALVEAVQTIAPYVLRKPRFAKLLHKVSQPTLVVHGTEDRLIQVETARWIARERPDWTVALFEGIGHVPMYECPEKLLEVIRAWMDAGAVPATS